MKDPHENNGMSRRRFLTLAGGTAGLTTLAAMGLAPGWGENRAAFDPDDMDERALQTDVLVIGGGMAGLFAAVKAHDAGARVMVLSKGRLGASGQTPFAKGIFAFDAREAGISLDAFVAEVSRSALGTNNPVYTRQMAEHSAARVAELREWGFFDSPLYNKAFSRPMETRGIPLIERVMVTHLIEHEGRIAGAAGFTLDDGQLIQVAAKSVILCTGAGGFKPNGFPICDLTHDGSVMAYRIGAKVTGKEWNDGHPGQAQNPAACFDGWHGMFERKPDVTGVGIRHDLGVELNYAAYIHGASLPPGPPDRMAETLEGGPYRPQGFDHPHGPPPPPGGRPLAGGADHRPPPPGAKGGPGGGPGDRPGGDKGPPGMRGAPVGGSSAGMAIHKSEGLVPINDRCASNIPGLYAAGDALGSYMAGAIYTQIGSSLAGSAVQGAVAGEAAAEYSKGVQMPSVPADKLAQVEREMLAPLRREAGYGPAWVTQTLQGIMIPNFVLYIKKESMLKAALAYIEELRDHHLPMLRASDLHELRLAHETANMIVSAEMKLKASLMRTESRCSHFRLDYPDMDDANWRAWINIHQDAEGRMRLEKQPFDRWPA
ncbi:FAD-dependent oxidoreductase [Thiocystis violacea]|uniref:FAD-dependent oxidoreductase n=1 Tax=Thiocystis violacea TaxID=13725 RepID=UPI0019062874|nr:FAD-binding protein [Thiocystis violacea]MBK1721254.1 succinate dehydrogenase/fumarate reductase flavoprotein subunit [Thiocystis violacea]